VGVRKGSNGNLLQQFPALALLLQTRASMHRVRAVLDQALSAASNPAAQTPASVLQQLHQAKELYESDQEASLQLVERLLADVDDAEVGGFVRQPGNPGVSCVGGEVHRLEQSK